MGPERAFRGGARRRRGIVSVLASLLLPLPLLAATFGRLHQDLRAEPRGVEGIGVALALLEVAAMRVADGPVLQNPTRAAIPAGMILLPMGGFPAGSRSEEGNADEHPRHWAQLTAFAVDKTEVTRGAYAACVATGSCAPAGQPDAALETSATPEPDTFPVTRVRWQDAADYCKWAGKRLPTEAEWEYAARSGGRDERYPWGAEDASCSRAWMTGSKSGCDTGRPAAPCTVAAGASAQGVCDLVGNVWEWTADWYGPYQTGAAWNPRGLPTGLAHTVRGGSWLEFPRSSRAAARAPRLPDTRAADLGFRCVLPLDVAADLPPATANKAAAPVSAPAKWSTDSSPHADPATGLRYFWLPGGDFHFGCEPRDMRCFSDEKPGTEQTVAGFWLAENPVTQAGYDRCVDAGICGAANDGGSCNARVPGNEQHPVNCVSWYQAETYCAWAGGYLPTAMQWEWAAKGGEGRIFPWGDAEVDATRANFCEKQCGDLHPDWIYPDRKQDDGWADTSPVASYPAGVSRHGLFDLVGNAAQWTATPSGLAARQARGGGWDLYARYLRNSTIISLPASHWFDNVTIRCAR